MAISPNGQVGPDFRPVGFDQSDLKPQTFGPQGGQAGSMNYSVNQLKYPLYTGMDKDLQHYMVFFVNIRGKSKATDFSRKTEIKPIGQNRFSGEQLVQGGAGVLGGSAGIALGASLGKSVGANLAKTNIQKVRNIVLTGAAAATGGVVGAQGTQWLNDKLKAFVPDKTFRIDTAMMLAINEKPSVKYGVDYDAKDLGTFIGYLAGGVGGVEMVQGQQTAELARAMVLNLSNIPSGIANALGGNLAISEAIQAGTGLAPNPFREQIFRNVDTRTFVFDYKFLPRSKAEADSVKNIIYKFKYHMHPEVSDGGLFYIYPSTFDIAYYFKGKENTNLHKISTCVLERMAVDYGGQGFNTFEDGVPTEINMRLEFRELEIMTKKRISEGY